MVIRPESSGLSAARRRMSSVARDLDLSSDELAELLIAVGEAVSNAYVHGSPDRDRNFIYIGWHFANGALTVTVRDEGPGFAPCECTLPPCDTSSLRGHGICLMRKSVDEVNFRFDDGARVMLTKRAPSAHRP